MQSNRFLICTEVLTLCLMATASTGRPAADKNSLNFVSASVVNLQDQSEIEWLGGDHRPSDELLKITFSSSIDLGEIARRYDYHVSTKIYFCEDGADKYKNGIARYSDVYSNQRVVAYDMKREAGQRTTHQQFLYYLYFDVVRSPSFDVFRKRLPGYDLHRDPRDLCVQVHGGNMLGESYDTNILTIPKDAIASALKSTN
jgi:hypothetical protein